MNPMINTLTSSHLSMEILDRDGSLLNAIEALKSDAILKVENIHIMAEAEMIQLHDQNKKAAEKKAYQTKEYGEEIFLQFLLEECRLYLSFIKILEMKIDEFLERQKLLTSAEQEIAWAELETRVKDVFKAQVKQEPLNQEQEKLSSKIFLQLAALDSSIVNQEQKRESMWGAATWDEGVKKIAKEAVQELKKLDLFEGHALPSDKVHDAKDKIEGFYKDLEEKFSHRAPPDEVIKLKEAANRIHNHKFTPEPVFMPEASANIPVAPVIDKIYAPSNKHIRSQYEKDTQVLLAANSRNLYQSVYDSLVPEKSFTRMGVEYSEQAMKKVFKPQYVDKIHDYMNNSIILKNLHQKKNELNLMAENMNLHAHHPSPLKKP